MAYLLNVPADINTHSEYSMHSLALRSDQLSQSVTQMALDCFVREWSSIMIVIVDVCSGDDAGPIAAIILRLAAASGQHSFLHENMIFDTDQSQLLSSVYWNSCLISC
jgi:hypothetical protein